MLKKEATKCYTQYHNYLNEEFYNKRGDLCRIVETKKRYINSHVTIENTTTNEKYLMLIREYECHAAFGSYLIRNDELDMLYG